MDLVTKVEGLVEDQDDSGSIGDIICSGTGADRDVPEWLICFSEWTDIHIVVGLSDGYKVGATADSVGVVIHLTSECDTSRIALAEQATGPCGADGKSGC